MTAHAGRSPNHRVSRFELKGEKFVVISVSTERRNSAAVKALSSAEREVMTLALSGLSNAEIAEQRGTALRTVANQVASLFKKLGVGSRAELASRYG